MIVNQNSDDQAKKQTGPADLPFWSIVRSLTTGQFYGIILVILGLFGAGYAIGEWSSSASHERELADNEEAHRQVIAAKDQTISQRDNRISSLEADLEAANANSEEALQVASGADRTARAFRAKAEFLDRYLSYLQDPIPSGTMQKLFADHVCVLWRETQRDILYVNSDPITFQEVTRGTNLSPAVLEALSTAGIDQRMIDEYLQLNRMRSQIEPRATPSSIFDPSNDAAFRRLQQLEQRIGGALEKRVSTKTITFFDGSRYVIPQPVADEVHLRADCQT